MNRTRLTRRMLEDQRGQTTIEWALLLGVFGLPMIYLVVVLLSALCAQYRMITLIETLPLP